MFAGDTKIFREIKILGDVSSLQIDLGRLETWYIWSRLKRSKVQGSAHNKENKAHNVYLQTY